MTCYLIFISLPEPMLAFHSMEPSEQIVKFKWKYDNFYTIIFIQENAFEDVVLVLVAISSRPQCVSLAGIVPAINFGNVIALSLSFTYQIDIETMWTLFCRRHVLNKFHEWKLLHFDQISVRCSVWIYNPSTVGRGTIFKSCYVTSRDYRKHHTAEGWHDPREIRRIEIFQHYGWTTRNKNVKTTTI